MGGEGNLADAARAALRDELTGARLSDAGRRTRPGMPGVEEFTRLYCVAGFADVQRRADRRGRRRCPAASPDWVKTFRAGLMDVAMVPEWERDDVAAAVEAPRSRPTLRQADGSWLRRLCAAPLLDAEAGLGT